MDYELPSGVMRKNRSITRYAQEHRSTAEREERLSYKMKSKAVWVAEKETEKNKNGDTWAKQELKAIKKWSWYFIQLFVLMLTLYYHTSFFFYIFSYLSFFFLYLFTSSCSD